jgi:hypothetical protein
MPVNPDAVGEKGGRSGYLNEDGIPAAWPWTLQRFREEMKTPEFRDFALLRNAKRLISRIGIGSTKGNPDGDES